MILTALLLKVFPSVFSSFGKAERQAERIAAMLVGQKGQSEDHWEANAKAYRGTDFACRVSGGNCGRAA